MSTTEQCEYRPKYETPDYEGFESLLLVYGDFQPPRDVWDGWTAEQRARVYDHYADRLYQASDNIIRRPRPRPDFLPAEWPN